MLHMQKNCIHILGLKPQREVLNTHFNKLPIRSYSHRLDVDLDALSSEKVLCFLLIAPTDDGLVLNPLTNLKQSKKFRDVPVFILCHKDTPPELSWVFYKNKAEGVFSFEHTSKEIVQVISEVIQRKQHGHPLISSAHRRLRTFLRSCLYFNKRFDRIKLKGTRSKIRLSGKARTLHHVRKAAEIMNKCPGVKSVDYKRLHVDKLNLSDAQLLDRSRMILGHCHIRTSDIQLKVKKHRLILNGYVDTEADKSTIEKIFSLQWGVLEIYNHLIVSGPMRDKSRSTLEKQLEKDIKSQFNTVTDLDIQLSKKQARIHGKVSLDLIKKLIEEFVIQNSTVISVQNELKVI